MKLDAKIANDNDHFWPRPQTPRLNHPRYLRSLWRPQPPCIVLVPAVISCSELLEELSRHLVPSHGAFPIHVLSHLANSNGKWHLWLMSGLRATTPKPTYQKQKPTPWFRENIWSIVPVPKISKARAGHIYLPNFLDLSSLLAKLLSTAHLVPSYFPHLTTWEKNHVFTSCLNYIPIIPYLSHDPHK